MSAAALLDKLSRLEQAAAGDPALLAQVDATYAGLADKAPLTPVLVARNQFRVRHAARLPRTRPRILIGAMNDSHFPNFHTIPMLKLADVVSLTTAPGPHSVERVAYQPMLQTIDDICARLPAGFAPDFFFDNFIDAHWLPLGLERAPFPTVGGIVHHYRSHMIAAQAPLFDYLLPLAPGFGEGLRAMGVPGQVLDIPIGANWGSFHHVLPPGGPKTIDLAVTFGPGSQAVNLGYRHFLYRTMRRIADAHPQFNIVFAHGLKKLEFDALLAQARIVVNTPGLHGPWNYRNCEAAAMGAMVIHLQYPSPVNWDLGDYLADGEEIALATPDTLEEVTLRYLDDPARAEQIGRNGYEAMKSRFSYEEIYGQLIARIMSDRAAGCAIAKGKPSTLAARRSLGRSYFECDLPELRPMTLHALAALDDLPVARQANDSAALVYEVGELGDKPGLLTAYAPRLAKQGEGAASFVARQMAAAGTGPTASYNRAMLAILSAAHNAQDLAAAAIATLERGLNNESDWLILARPRPPHLDAAEWDETILKLWEGRHLAAKGNDMAQIQTKLDFMLWQMHRYLADAASQAEARRSHLAQAMALFPDNASLHLMAAKAAPDRETALAHANAALAAYPLMDAAMALKDEIATRDYSLAA